MLNSVVGLRLDDTYLKVKIDLQLGSKNKERKHKIQTGALQFTLPRLCEDMSLPEANFIQCCLFANYII